jgi:hypothetical protein
MGSNFRKKLSRAPCDVSLHRNDRPKFPAATKFQITEYLKVVFIRNTAYNITQDTMLAAQNFPAAGTATMSKELSHRVPSPAKAKHDMSIGKLTGIRTISRLFV